MAKALTTKYGYRSPLTHNGETKPVTEWAKQLGLSPSTITTRLNKQGWSVDKALTTPPDSYGNKLAAGKTIKEGILARIMKAIERNSKEVEEQIDQAVKSNLFQLLKEITPLLPKEQAERAEKAATQNVGIKIELVKADPTAIIIDGETL